MVDMAHDRHHRRTWLERFWGIDVGFGLNVDVGFGDAVDAVAELLDQQLGGVLVDRLGDRDRGTHLEQGFDEVGTAFAHALGEFLHGDGFGNVDIAILFDGRPHLLVVALFLLTGAAERGQAAGAAVVFAGERTGNGQLAGMAAFVDPAAIGAGMGRSRPLRRMSRRGGTAELAIFLNRLGGRFGSGAGRFLGGEALSFRSLLNREASGLFLGLAIFLGAALLFLGLLLLGAVLAAARLLERGHASLFGLAQQAFLHFLAGGNVVDRALGRRLGGGGGRLRRGGDGGRFGLRLGRRGFAGLAEDAPLLDLHDDGIRAAVAEALLHLAGLDRALQAQRWPGTELGLFRLVGHAFPSSTRLLAVPGRAAPIPLMGARSNPASGSMKACHRSMARVTRLAAAASVKARCTTFSRPSATDKMVRPSGKTKPWLSPPLARAPTLRAWSSFLRPSSPASAAWISS